MTDPGRFIWYDLYTSDLDAASRFYAAVVGWTIKDSGHPTEKYLVLHPPGESGMGVGGMMGRRPDMADVQPFWGGYVYASDVDASAARAQKLGGALHRGPMDIPHVGRFAVMSDPQGGAFYLFKPNGAGELTQLEQPGYIGWRELHTTDDRASFAFYSELLGWKKELESDMGPHGTYTIWNAKDGQRGGLMRDERSHWLFYFNVASVEQAAERVKREGGQIVTSVMQQPEGGFIAHGKDPQGALFGLAGPK